MLVGVFGNDVLVEKPEGALVGRGGEADQAGIKVVEHLLPQVVDAAVAFIDDDEVEGFHRYCRVVAHELFLLDGLLEFVERQVFGGIVDGLAGEDRIHALDGADADLRMRVDAGRRQPLHVVKLGELAGIVGRRIGHEFLMRLLAEVAGIDQKQDALGAAELEQAINRCDGGEGLACAGGHVDQGAGSVLGQGLFQSGDSADLAVTQILDGQGRHLLGQTAAQGFWLRQPCSQCFRLEEVEDFAGTRRGVKVVGKADDLAGGLEQETQGCVVLAPFEVGGGVALGLGLNNGEVFTCTVFLGLNHACRIAIYKQHIVGWAGIGGVFTYRDANCCAKVDLFHVLNDPAGLNQLLVDP